MRLFNVRFKKEGFPWGEVDVLALGERGRGRNFVLIPFLGEFSEEADDYEIENAETPQVRIIRTRQPSEGWIARINSEGTYTRDTIGAVYVHQEDRGKIKVIARGLGAYGLAGRIGSWSDYLIQVTKTPTRIFVRPSGGAEKVPRYWLVFFQKDVYRVGVPEVGVFAQLHGIHLPDSQYAYRDIYRCPIEGCSMKEIDFSEREWKYHVNYHTDRHDPRPEPVIIKTELISLIEI